MVFGGRAVALLGLIRGAGATDPSPVSAACTVAPNHEHWTTIKGCELVLSYDVRPYMKRIIDDITMTEFEVPHCWTIPSPEKKLVQVGEGVSPMSLYDTPDHLRIVGEACAEFAKELSVT